jgi:hypothetical protein
MRSVGRTAQAGFIVDTEEAKSINIFDAETIHPEEMQRVGSQAIDGNVHLRREAKHAY